MTVMRVKGRADLWLQWVTGVAQPAPAHAAPGPPVEVERAEVGGDR
jgi:hypothetical protein